MTQLFNSTDRAIFWNMNRKAIQRMLDYDYICRREYPSVAVIVHPTSDAVIEPFFFGSDEVLGPVRKTTKEAALLCPKASVFLNFASFRTAYSVTKEALTLKQIKTVMITAEGIPERHGRQLVAEAKQKNILFIGPQLFASGRCPLRFVFFLFFFFFFAVFFILVFFSFSSSSSFSFPSFS